MYIDIETSAGVKCGDGPIITAEEFTATKRLDRAGSISFPMPATDEKSAIVLSKRVARAKALINGTMTEVGAGIVDEISVKTNNKGGADLDVSGDELLRELTYHHVGKTEIGTSTVPATTGPADIATMFPAGWSLDLVTGHNSTLKAIHHKFEGESCLAALIKLVELTGEHFRLGTGRKLIWMQDDRPDSGLRAIQGGEPVGLESNLDVCIITKFEQTQDTYDCYIGRIYGYGVGDGDSRVHFHDAVNNHVPEGYVISSDAMGWYFQHTTTYAAYGIQRYMSFKDVNDATTLCEQAYEWMSRRLAAQKSYRLSVTKLDREVAVGSTIRVVYKRIVDGFVAINVDADMVILEATTKTDQTGARTVDFQVATTDAWPDSDTSATVDGLGQGQNFYTHSQGFASSTDVWSVIASALGEIILYDSGGICQFFPATAAGVASANAAAGSGDVVYFPACDITLSTAIVIASGVTWRGQGDNSIVRGGVTISGVLLDMYLVGESTLVGLAERVRLRSGSVTNAVNIQGGILRNSIVEVASSIYEGISFGASYTGIVLDVYVYQVGAPMATTAVFIDPGAPSSGIYLKNVFTYGCNQGLSCRGGSPYLLDCAFFGRGYGGGFQTSGSAIVIKCDFRALGPGTIYTDIFVNAGATPTFIGVSWTTSSFAASFTYGESDRAKANHAHASDYAPLAHHTRHESGGADALKLDDLVEADANTDLNATAAHHGLLPALSGDNEDYLLGDGTWGIGTPATITVEEQDGAPTVANVVKIKVTNGSLTDDGAGVVSLVTGGGGGTLTVEEQDGVPTVASVTKIKVTNGTLTDDGGGVVSLDTGGGGGGHVIQDDGVNMTARAHLNFVGDGVAATDDALHDATIITIGGHTGTILYLYNNFL